MKRTTQNVKHIPPGLSHNFDEMVRAADNGDLCIVDTWDTKENKQVIVVCIAQRTPGEVELMPVAIMIDHEKENVFDRYLPPAVGGGYEREPSK